MRKGLWLANSKSKIALIVIVALLSFIAGFYLGVEVVIQKVAEEASRFIDIDKELILEYLRRVGI